MRNMQISLSSSRSVINVYQSLVTPENQLGYKFKYVWTRGDFHAKFTEEHVN